MNNLPELSSFPESFAALKDFCCWKKVWDDGKQKFKKPPYSPITGEAIGAVEKYRDDFTDLATAIAACTIHSLDGPSIVFTGKNKLCGIDIDGCVTDGIIHPKVQNWIPWFSGAYKEFSPSRKGIHLIFEGEIGKAVTAIQFPEAEGVTVEMYDHDRHFTLTGNRIGDLAPIGRCDSILEKLKKHLNIESSATPVTDGSLSLTKSAIQRIHQSNLDDLLNAIHGEGNTRLNQAAYFAGRAFAAGALDGTEASIKQALIDIVTKQWKDPISYGAAKGTIESGWGKGSSEPIIVREEAFPQLEKLVDDWNTGMFLIRKYGGKARIGWFANDLTVKDGNSEFLDTQSIVEFKNGYLNEFVKVGVTEEGEDKFDTKASAWLKHPRSRKYDRVVFLPNEKMPADVLNLWRGFLVDPRKGDCSLYINHIYENICMGEDFKYDYLIRWMAYAVRHPGEQGYVAITISGKKGVGKNVFAETFSELWGTHGMVVNDSDRLTGNFNAHLRDKCLLVADEAFFAASKRQDNILKSLVTGPNLNIEQKGIDVVKARNLLHIIIIGNSSWLIQATKDERRYLSLECADTKKEDTKYFQAIRQQMKNGGYAALLHHLLHEVDLTGFEVRKPPHTRELQRQMVATTDGANGYWQECLVKGVLPGHKYSGGDEEVVLVRIDDLLTAATESRNRAWQNLKSSDLQQLLGKNGMNFIRATVSEKGVKTKYWHIPSLQKCRELWRELHYNVEWQDTSDEWETVESHVFNPQRSF